MRISIDVDRCECIREKNDPRFYGIKDAKGESNFLYFLQQYLNNRKIITMNDNGSPVHVIIQGRNEENNLKNRFIKKRMYKDGHMVSDMQQYLRTTKSVMFYGNKCLMALYNDHFAINGLEEDWNNEKAVLRVSFLPI